MTEMPLLTSKSHSVFHSLFLNLWAWLGHVVYNNPESTEHMFQGNAVKKKERKKKKHNNLWVISFISVTLNTHTHLFSSYTEN